jgi:hypothetical protein
MMHMRYSVSALVGGDFSLLLLVLVVVVVVVLLLPVLRKDTNPASMNRARRHFSLITVTTVTEGGVGAAEGGGDE